MTISWVTVGDPGNTVAGTYGAVPNEFRIMEFEWTNSKHVAFLDAVAATDTYSLYDVNMGTDPRGGITQSGSPGSFTYAPKTNMGDKPVIYVTWFDAARVANWLPNGQGSGSTKTGAYALNNATSGSGPVVNPGALYFLRTADQWYKAAYYKGGGWGLLRRRRER